MEPCEISANVFSKRWSLQKSAIFGIAMLVWMCPKHKTIKVKTQFL